MQVCLFCNPLVSYSFCVFLNPCIQIRFPDAVGWAEILAVVHIAFAEILHPAVAVPGSDPGDEGTATITAGEESGIAVGGGVATVGS